MAVSHVTGYSSYQMAEGLCPELCLLETRALILSGSTAAFQELKGGVVFNKRATEKQAPLNTRTKEVFKFLLC